jgi:excisionase family DNA binding protein
MRNPHSALGALVWQSLLVSNVLDQVTQWITVPEAAELLDLPLGKVHRLIDEHELITVRVDGVKKIPADLIIDGEPLSSLKGTISVLLDSHFTLEEAIEWLYTPDESLPGTPMAALLAGRKTEIRRRAQALLL